MKILFIDDDPCMTEILGMMLAPGFASIKSVNNGTEGIKLARDWKPDIVLVDLVLPDMEGGQITAEIRTFSNVPILMMSVVDNPQVVARVLNAGADDYLIKPVPKNVLIAHVNNLTRRKRPLGKDSRPFEPTLAAM